MKYKRFIKSIILLKIIITLLILLTGCEKVAVKNVSEAKKLLKTIYPKKLQCDYEFVTLYSSKEAPESWSGFEWKKNNDYLEKTGLLKQIIIDSTIQFYDKAHAKFENKHQYLYKIIMSDELKSLISDSQWHSRTFDEYDYDNTKTGKQKWLNCKVVCGILTLDTILKIDQNDPPYASLIKYYERFTPTAFNNIVQNAKKFRKNEMFLHSIVAKKYEGEECRLIY